MPEGPSIVILKEAVQIFSGKKVLAITGNTKLDLSRFAQQKVISFDSFGKNFLICFAKNTIRIHFLLFGSYRINEEREATPRLTLHFKAGKINFYACSVKVFDEKPDKLYDLSVDVLRDEWNAANARKKLKKRPSTLVCDALLDQEIFAGVGNIIKNEVLFRIRVHPKTRIGDLPAARLRQLVKEARDYSFDFLEWKKQYVLRKNWLVHTKKTCPRDGTPIKKEYLGKTRRRTFYCRTCQVLY